MLQSKKTDLTDPKEFKMDEKGFPKYVAFFRGINVGGKNKVKMADLKQLFHDWRCDNVYPKWKRDFQI